MAFGRPQRATLAAHRRSCSIIIELWKSSLLTYHSMPQVDSPSWPCVGESFVFSDCKIDDLVRFAWLNCFTHLEHAWFCLQPLITEYILPSRLRTSTRHAFDGDKWLVSFTFQTEKQLIPWLDSRHTPTSVRVHDSQRPTFPDTSCIAVRPSFLLSTRVDSLARQKGRVSLPG